MKCRNHIELIGYVGADPELRYTNTNRPVTQLRLATTDRWKDSAGAPQERTEWHTVVFWDTQAVNVARFVKKGHALGVDGSIQYRTFTRDGVTRFFTQVRAYDFNLLERKDPAAASAPLPSEDPPSNTDSEPPAEDSDIPF